MFVFFEVQIVRNHVNWLIFLLKDMCQQRTLDDAYSYIPRGAQHSRFTLFEGQFKIRRITSQESKFYIIGCHLPPHILKKVAHVVSKMSKENPYDTLKREVLART